ncbi:MAG: hypothetical protein JWQ57_3395 [Mucilaginibacter sp.]|nr:hypothetical protein [Mucilaginibacter sp.]
MIVNYTEHGWELITQRAHGTLAAALASHWRHDVRTEKWLETLLAIAEHDDARVESIDEKILTKQGGPFDFKMTAFDYKHCTRTYEASLSKSRYVALLCSMHLDFVYGRLSQGHAEGMQFMKEQAALRKKWMTELGISEQQADRDYRLLEWNDALSLLICQREYQPQGRSVEISMGPDGQRHVLTQKTPGVLHVSPWPFEENEFEVQLESRLLGQLTFKNNDDFRNAFLAAGVITKRWTIKAL